MLILTIVFAAGMSTGPLAYHEDGAMQRVSSNEQLRAALTKCAGASADAFDACRRAVSLGLLEAGIALPDSPLVHERIAKAYALDGRVDEAAAVYRGAVRLFPKNAELHFALASLLIDRFNAVEEAWGPLREAVRYRPEFDDALLALGYVESELGYYDDSVRRYRGVLMRNPDSSNALAGLGMALSAQGNHEEAITVLQRLTRRPGADDADWTALSRAFLAAGRAKEAASAGEKAVTISRDNREAFCALSLALAQLGNMDEARTACQMAQRPSRHRAEACACRSK